MAQVRKGKIPLPPFAKGGVVPVPSRGGGASRHAFPGRAWEREERTFMLRCRSRAMGVGIRRMQNREKESRNDCASAPPSPD